MYVCMHFMDAYHKEHGCGRPNRGSVKGFKMVDNLFQTKTLLSAHRFDGGGSSSAGSSSMDGDGSIDDCGSSSSGSSSSSSSSSMVVVVV